MMSYAGQTSSPGLSAFSLSLLVVCGLLSEACIAEDYAKADGQTLMRSIFERHQQYPYVYEEQSMVLIDRNGNRETRKVKRFSRVESDHEARMLLLFDSPQEVKGVAILAVREPSGVVKQQIYLPSLGENMMQSTGDTSDANFLGTDFSVEDLTGEVIDDYVMRRQRDIQIDDQNYYVVDVFAKGGDAQFPLRRHFITPDHLFIVRTDYFDDLGRVKKRQSYHDLTLVLGNMWQANMLLMENLQEDHQTLIKIDRRVYSADYVPEEIFTPEWLYQFSHKEEVQKSSPDEDAEAKLLGETPS